MYSEKRLTRFVLGNEKTTEGYTYTFVESEKIPTQSVELPNGKVLTGQNIDEVVKLGIDFDLLFYYSDFCKFWLQDLNWTISECKKHPRWKRFRELAISLGRKPDSARFSLYYERMWSRKKLLKMGAVKLKPGRTTGD